MGAEAPRGSAGDLRRTIEAQAVEIAELRAELAERRDQVRAVIEHNPYPTWVYDLGSLRFLEVNDLAIQLYGWSRDEFLSMTIADIRPREDVPALRANVARMRDRPGGITGPWRHRDRGGTLFEVVLSFRSLPFSGQAARLIAAESLNVTRIASDLLPPCRLSPREREVLALVARGHTSQEIASRLGLSPKSVETYRARFRMKLSLDTRAQLVAYAIAHRLLGG
jgi:PAS domain S-box-containing protein